MASHLTCEMPQPFLKWAGGKRWFVSGYNDLLPSKFKTYYEPFLGSGAVFFHLKPDKSVLGDKNESLIATYAAIQANCKKVATYLKQYQKLHSEKFYYEERGSRHRSVYKEAARFIYLNRTCYNGLYRVNLKGTFNVPIGTKTEVWSEKSGFEKLSDNFKGSSFLVGDFEYTLKNVRRGDFVFLDPPYTVSHNNNGFIKYNEDIFKWSDQVRLAEKVNTLANLGVKILLLNADHFSVRKLYENFSITTLERQSVISGILTGRKKTTEIAVKINY